MKTRELGQLLLQNLGYGENTPYGKVAGKVGDLVDETMTDLAYHNVTHVHQVTLIAHDVGTLEGLSNKDAALLIISMLGHDLAHPGKSNKIPFENERAAIRALEPIIKSLPKDDQKQIEHTILATDPTQYDLIRKNYLEGQARGGIPKQAIVSALAVEADLTASVGLSVRQTRKNAANLVRETGIAVIDTPNAQKAFIASHEPFTKGAIKMGALDRSKQIQRDIHTAYEAGALTNTPFITIGELQAKPQRTQIAMER